MYKGIGFHDCVSFHCLNILTSDSGHQSPGLREYTRGGQPCPGHAAPLGISGQYIVCTLCGHRRRASARGPG